MRELKFRAWSKSGKKMIYNIQNEFEERIELGMDCFSDYLSNDDFIVEQYTGIKDKNDRKIYEGDIVSVYDGHYIGSINQYPSGEWKIIWVAPKGTVDSLYAHRTVCEVIGNIHENPELLEDRNN